MVRINCPYRKKEREKKKIFSLSNSIILFIYRSVFFNENYLYVYNRFLYKEYLKVKLYFEKNK
jgi:hypothetical protein